MRLRESSLKGHFPSKACSTMPSNKSPKVMSWYSAKPFSTLSRRFSMRTPVCTRSTSRGSFVVIMVPMYRGNYPAHKVSLFEKCKLRHGAGSKQERRQNTNRRLIDREEVLDQLLALICQYALRVELHTLQRKLPVTQPHDHACAVPLYGV